MKAVVYDAPRSFQTRDIPTPDPGPGEVRIKVIQVGVCGTDLHIHNGDFMARFPLIPGHELVGTVEALGDGATRVKVGEQVSRGFMLGGRSRMGGAGVEEILDETQPGGRRRQPVSVSGWPTHAAIITRSPSNTT